MGFGHKRGLTPCPFWSRAELDSCGKESDLFYVQSSFRWPNSLVQAKFGRSDWPKTAKPVSWQIVGYRLVQGNANATAHDTRRFSPMFLVELTTESRQDCRIGLNGHRHQSAVSLFRSS